MKTDRQRDAEMDGLLAGVLRPTALPPLGDCPPAGDLAAFVEGNLADAERHRLEDHFAACESCQEALAAIGRMPEDEGHPVPARLPATWLRWLVPAGAVAALLLVYLGVKPAFQPPAPESRIALSTAPIQAPPAAGVRGALAPPPTEAMPADMERSEAVKRERLAAGTDAHAGTGLKGPTPLATAPLPKATPSVSDQTKVQAAPAADEQVRAVAAPQKTAAAAPAQKEIVLDRVTMLPADAKLQQTKMTAAGTSENRAVAASTQPPAAAPAQPPSGPPPSVTPPGAAGARAAQPTFRVGTLAETVAVSAAPAPAKEAAATFVGLGAVVVAPPNDGSAQWRFERGGAIWRTTDGGKSWQMQRRADTADLLAGKAVDAVTCWAVGREGLVLLTTDGQKWETRPFPERVDLLGVTALDGRTATVTARDGRRFTTTDGGATWR